VAFAVLSLVGSRAHAQDSVLVADQPNSAFYRAMAAELRAIGFVAVSRAALVDEPSPERWGVALRAESALAAVVLRRSERGVSIWVYDRVTEKLSMRALRAAEADSPAHLAERCVELLRASLLETVVERRDGAAANVTPRVQQVVRAVLLPVAARVVSPVSARPRPLAWDVSVGLGLSWAPGGLSPTASVTLGVGRSVTGPLSFSWIASLALGSATVRGPEGLADAWWGATAAVVRMAALRSQRFQWNLGVGLGALVGNVTGSAARPDVEARSEWRALAAASASTAIVYSPLPGVGVRVAVDGFVPFGIADIRFSGRSVARLEAVWLVASVGAHIQW
jgi:hypothetical protein